jgi:hypothetical protein
MLMNTSTGMFTMNRKTICKGAENNVQAVFINAGANSFVSGKGTHLHLEPAFAVGGMSPMEWMAAFAD